MSILSQITCISITWGLLLVLAGCDAREVSSRLDEADKSKRVGTDERIQDLMISQQPIKFEDSELWLLNQFAGTQTTYGARKVHYDESEGGVTLDGEAWVRSGSHLLDGREDPNSHIRLDKKSGKVIEKKGTFKLSVLVD